MDRGWVCLHRKSLESEFFQDANLWKVWSWCLMKASHKSRWTTMKVGKNEETVHLLPGQFIFGRHKAAEELNMTDSGVWSRIQRIIRTGALNIASNRHYSIVTVENWEIYQHPEPDVKQDKEQPQVTADEQPLDTDNNVNNVDNSLSPEAINLAKHLAEGLKQRERILKNPNLE